MHKQMIIICLKIQSFNHTSCTMSTSNEILFHYQKLIFCLSRSHTPALLYHIYIFVIYSSKRKTWLVVYLYYFICHFTKFIIIILKVFQEGIILVKKSKSKYSYLLLKMSKILFLTICTSPQSTKFYQHPENWDNALLQVGVNNIQSKYPNGSMKIVNNSIPQHIQISIMLYNYQPNFIKILHVVQVKLQTTH